MVSLRDSAYETKEASSIICEFMQYLKIYVKFSLAIIDSSKSRTWKPKSLRLRRKKCQKRDMGKKRKKSIERDLGHIKYVPTLLT